MHRPRCSGNERGRRAGAAKTAESSVDLPAGMGLVATRHQLYTDARLDLVETFSGCCS